MLLSCRPSWTAYAPSRDLKSLLFLVWLCWAGLAHGMIHGELETLKDDARYVFYHGLTNYHRYAYPEDELRPLSCRPLTRDRANPAHIEVNDVLGNYSLSIVDSLSTLAILASSPTSVHDNYNALDDFQRYTSLLVQEYGDGTDGPAGQGKRARGFDLDSKVQVFETTIRGVGGLLSAHLFAIGELPIRGYNPEFLSRSDGSRGISWNVKGDLFFYDGQLLRLALDLAERLLPAFHTPTGLPYPRVNLRHGIPFYANSPLNNDPEHGQCGKTRLPNTEREVTETCSAGAGSLVLEFTTLSRLTGDERFERLAKQAFWAVWERRSQAGLIGAGLDAETGQWVSPYTGIGAGIDSFFEYAYKSHVLLSGLPQSADDSTQSSSEQFLQAWQDAHAAISRHIYRGAHFQHPHYAQNDLYTGGPRLAWIDSLSAYYPGLLTLAGELDEAITTHLLYTALWTRYGALPERWNAHTGKIEAGLRWWGGRPEFIESTWYLYRATQDPWYLHVGEMTLRDIKRRCYTKCGWAGLQDVRTGEQSDRMESFFLGETAKYLYLLFDADHPLNTMDAPYVFTTEGHPLVVPRHLRHSQPSPVPRTKATPSHPSHDMVQPQCPSPPPLLPFTISATAARADLFHAAALARLHLMPQKETPNSPLLDYAADHPSISVADVRSPSNYTYYPWTLPLELVPHNGQSSQMTVKQTFDLTFPALPNTPLEMGMLQRLDSGILINSISGLRFGMIIESLDNDHLEDEQYRIYSLSNLALGRDENLYLGAGVLAQVNPTDPHFTRLRDTEIVDLLVDVLASSIPSPPLTPDHDEETVNATFTDFFGADNILVSLESLDEEFSAGEHILDALPNMLFADGERLADELDSLANRAGPGMNMKEAFSEAARVIRASQTPSHPKTTSPEAQGSANTPTTDMVRYTVPAMLATGPGAAALPAAVDNGPDPSTLDIGRLPYQTIFLLDSDLCTHRLPLSIATGYTILVVRRGGCSFSDKLANIPSYAPAAKALQLVVIVSFPEQEDQPGGHVRPLLDKVQLTPSGMERRNPIATVMISGSDEVWATFRRAAAAVGIVRAGEVVVAAQLNRAAGQATDKRNAKARGRSGVGVKRRYFFTSQGIRISNLFLR